jgi:hypothetical protein
MRLKLLSAQYLQLESASLQSPGFLSLLHADALCFVLCALCFVLCALCFVLCASCFLLKITYFGQNLLLRAHALFSVLGPARQKDLIFVNGSVGEELPSLYFETRNVDICFSE